MSRFTDDSNAELLGYMAMAEDDPEGARNAFAEFYERHVGWTHSIIARLPNTASISREDIVDIVQDTFLDAFRGAGTFKVKPVTNPDSERRQARAWIGGIAKRVILRHLTGSTPLVDADEIYAAAPAADDPEQPEPPLVIAARTFLEQLDERDKDILLTWLYEYKPGQQSQRISNTESKALAERLHTSPENIRQRRKRLFDKFRATLQPGQIALEKSR